jgi:hypothetical protein
MSQNDYTIANQTTPLFRADLNNALQALASNSSGATAPATTYANMTWYDTGTNILKIRSEANSAWINVAYVDQSTNAWGVLDNTKVVSTSGTQTGLLGDQTTATWQTGTGTTESLVSPAKVKAAIQALMPSADQDFALLARATLSNNATAVFTAFDGANYDSYTFVFSDVNAVAVTGSFNLQMSSDGGATYSASSNNYYYAYNRNDNGQNYTVSGQSGTVPLTPAVQISRSLSGTLNVYAPHTSTENTKVDYVMVYQAGTNSLSKQEGVGVRNSAAVVNAVRFYFQGTNMESGSITMYGKRKA